MSQEIPPLPERDLTCSPSRRTGRGTPLVGQRLSSDVLQIVIDGHLLPNKPLDRQLLDDLIRMPDDKLRLFCMHLQEDLTSRHSLIDVVACQIDVDTPIPADATQVRPVIEYGQPPIRINPFWKGRQGRQAGKGDARRDIATGSPLMRPLIIVMLEEGISDLAHFLQRCWLMPL
jgi:hypothetical protein